MRKLCLLIFIPLFFSCATSKRIKKVPLKKYLNRYPTAFYLRGIGEGPDEQTAKDNARIELAKKIKVEIKAKIVEILKEESGHTQKLKEEFIRISSAEVDDVLAGVEIPYCEFDSKKGTYIALAVLSREKTVERIKKKIKRVQEDIKNHFKNAQRLAIQKDIVNSINEFMRTYMLLTEYYTLKEEKEIISTGLEKELQKTEDKKIIGFSDIERNILDNLKSLEIKVLKKPDRIRKGKTGNYEIVLEVYFRGKPQKGVPLKMEILSGKANLMDRGTTDGEGKAKFTIFFVDPSSSDPLKLKLKLDDERLIPKGIPLMFSSFLSSIFESASIPIDIYLEGKGFNDIEQVVNVLIKELKIEKFKEKKLFVEDFLKEGIRGDELGRDIQEKLTELLVKKGLRITKRYENADLILKGRYYIYSDYINIKADLEDKKEVVYSSASASLDREILKNYINLPEGTGTNVISDISYGNLEIKIWVDRGENGIYREGEEAIIFVRASKKCFIRIYDFSSTGEITPLFPNEYSPSGWIEGGKTYRIPGDFGGFKIIANPPYGTEIIKVFASTQEFETPKMMNQEEFVENIRGLQVERDVEYAEASTVISIVPR